MRVSTQLICILALFGFLAGCAGDPRVNRSLTSLWDRQDARHCVGGVISHKTYRWEVSEFRCDQSWFSEVFLPELDGNNFSYVKQRLSAEGFTCDYLYKHTSTPQMLECDILLPRFLPKKLFGVTITGYVKWKVVATKRVNETVKLDIDILELEDKYPEMKDY